MVELLGNITQQDILTILGLLLVIAFLGSKIFQHFGIPQVVGFIVVGMFLGPSFLNLVPLQLSRELTFVSNVALGLIGFDIGSHLRLDELRDLGRSIVFILLFEAIGTFLVVFTGVYLVTRSLPAALIFGALSSATAPAATVDVLAEYDAKGPLTTTLLAVIGLDDALALILFSLASTLAGSLLAGSTPSALEMVGLPLIEIGGSLVLGVAIGFILDLIMCRMKSHHDAMAVSIGFVFVGVGISQIMEFSLILTTMIMGIVLVNRHQVHARHIRFTIEQAGPVIYILFFALVGARLEIHELSTIGWLGGAYVVLRSLGKFSGAWIGGRLGGAAPVVRNNLGFGLLTQGGVAIGLALSSSTRFADISDEGQALGTLVLTVITATTFVVEIIGPLFVKFAVVRSGEAGQAKLGADAWASEGAPE